MEPIETILEKEFPELLVDIPALPVSGDIEQDELSAAIRYMRDHNLVRDAISLLSSINPLRDSVSYPIIFPDQRRKLIFSVERIQGPGGYIGYLRSRDDKGEEAVQVRFYGIYFRG